MLRISIKEGVSLKDAIDDSNLFKNLKLFLILPLVKYKTVEKFYINHLLFGFNEIYESCQLEYSWIKTFLKLSSKSVF